MYTFRFAGVAIFASAGLLLAAPAQAQHVPAGQFEPWSAWTVETVDDVGNVGLCTSLAVFPPDHPDLPGRPAISYCDHPSYGNRLWYAYRDGQEWIKQTVDQPSGAVGHTSLIIFPLDHLDADLAGQPAISYHEGLIPPSDPDRMLQDLRFAWFDGQQQQWNTTIVDSAGGEYTSLAMLPLEHPTLGGQPVIAYYCGGDLKFAWHSGGFDFFENWNNTVVDTGGDQNHDVGQYASLEIMPYGHVAISYYDATAASLKFAWYEDYFGWQSEVVDGDPNNPAYDAGKYGRLSVFPSDHPYLPGQPGISYFCEGPLPDETCLKFAWHEETAEPGAYSWVTAKVDTSDSPNLQKGRWTSLAILPCGHPAISYNVRGIGARIPAMGLHFAEAKTNDPNTWQDPDGWDIVWHLDLCGYEEWVGEYTSLAVLRNRQPAISYYDRRSGDLKYAQRRTRLP